MALKSSNGLVPRGAVALDQQEAIHYQWHQVKNWPNRWDTLAIVYGVPAIGFLAGISGYRINNHYRVKLKLRRYGEASTKLAMTVTPIMFTIATHYVMVTHDLFLDKSCKMCSYTTGLAIQVFMSTLFPMMLSPIANFMFATRHGTYPLPYWSDVKGTLKLLSTLHKSLGPKVKIVLPLQIVAAPFMTYMEIRELNTLKKKIESGEVEAPHYFL